MVIERGCMPEHFGFVAGKRSVHQARSMMGNEIVALLDHADASVDVEGYKRMVVEDNLLNKATSRNRSITYNYLRILYGLDSRLALFRAVCGLWPSDDESKQFLVFQLAYTRDPLLRHSADFILRMPIGRQLTKDLFEEVVGTYSSTAYSPASLASFGRNLASTWTQAGFLSGKVAKYRSRPKVSAVHAAFACFCAWLDGWQGESLFDAPWLGYLDLSRGELIVLVESAARQGLFRLLRAGGVYEFRFPGWLSADEEALRVQD